MVDETERAGLEIALRAALRDQARAGAAVDFLREKLGLAAANAQVVLGPGDSEAAPEGPRDVGPVPVSDGEFYGMSQMKAAETFLERATRSRPQKTDTIVAALKKGGVQLGSANPENVLYSHMIKNGKFRRVGKGTWGLSAWYPPVAKRASKGDTEAPATAGISSEEGAATEG